MIRIQYSTDLPFLAEAGSNGRHIGLIVNPDMQSKLSLEDKQRLFNALMAEFDHVPAVSVQDRANQASAVIIDLQVALARRHEAAVRCPKQRSST